MSSLVPSVFAVLTQHILAGAKSLATEVYSSASWQDSQCSPSLSMLVLSGSLQNYVQCCFYWRCIATVDVVLDQHVLAGASAFATEYSFFCVRALFSVSV